MPTKERTLAACVETYLASKQKKKRAEVTVKNYRWLIGKANRRLTEGGFTDLHPKRWTVEHVQYLYDRMMKEIGPNQISREFAVLNNYLEFFGNPVIKKQELEFPADTRVRVDWLTPEQAMRLIDATASPLEKVIVHLELCIGMRRVEVLRLRVQDIKLGTLDVLGKGRLGGKWRTNPFHRNTIKVLEEYTRARDALIEKMRKKHPALNVPDRLLIHGSVDGVQPYQRSSIDKVLGKLSKRVGFKFTNHTLRRTFGRMLWLAGVPIETIRDLLGHEDTKTTLLYIGVNMDDKTSAMDQLADYENAVRTADSGVARKRSGHWGISPPPTIWLPDILPSSRHTKS